MKVAGFTSGFKVASKTKVTHVVVPHHNTSQRFVFAYTPVDRMSTFVNFQ